MRVLDSAGTRRPGNFQPCPQRDSTVVNRVFGIFACRHKHTSLPFPAMMATAAPATLDENPEQPVTSNHYVVCLECGKRLSYDWSKMRLVKGS